MNNYGRSESTCYTRTSGDEKYHLTVNITKSRIGNLSEALYSYSLKDLKTGKECCFEDQELNRVYTLEEVVIASRPYFELIACFGDYDLQAKFDPYNSERIVMVFQIKGGGL